MLVLALPLALLAPSGARAQAKDEAKSPPATGWSRQIISNKLDRIRFDRVSYQGLPLSEVVINLREESKKRDPEKKGVNFLINPNGGAVRRGPVVGPTGQPITNALPEAMDIDSVYINLRPPLEDVRLVDVLDAVVTVADYPIKYSIEEYGVVVSMQESEPARREEIEFAFPGGTPSQFIDAVQKQYAVDWLSVADIAKELADAHIPKLRLGPDSLGPGSRSAGVEPGPLAALVSLYNELGKQKPELGRLIVKGDLAKPSIVMFVPDKAATHPRPK